MKRDYRKEAAEELRSDRVVDMYLGWEDGLVLAMLGHMEWREPVDWDLLGTPLYGPLEKK